MLQITRSMLTHPTSRPALKDAAKYELVGVKAIVVHWTANTRRGANAMANRNYFNLGSRAASAHFIVDDRTIVQCLPEYEVGYHCGDKPLGKYKAAGLATMQGTTGLTPNFFTIGVEMCVNEDADWSKTRKNTIELVAWLMAKHNRRTENLLRHWDVTGKLCPQMLLDAMAWQQFKKDVENAMKWHTQLRYMVASVGLNVRAGAGVRFPILVELRQGDPVVVFETRGEWWRIEGNGWVNSRYLISA